MTQTTADATADNYLNINNIEVIYDHVILVLAEGHLQPAACRTR